MNFGEKGKIIQKNRYKWAAYACFSVARAQIAKISDFMVYIKQNCLKLGFLNFHLKFPIERYTALCIVTFH